MSQVTTAPSGHREVEHGTTVAAPAADVYRLLADVGDWPQIFPPSVHIEHLERGADHERIQLWATANGEPKTWISRRELDPAALRIGFRQERSTAPVAAMGGTWVVEPISDDACRVRLLHDYRAVDDDPDGLEWIATAVDRNSRSELAALKADAELRSAGSGLLLTLEDTVTIDGAARDAYDFVNEAQLWPERLPHVASARLQEDTPGLQVLEMDTRTPDGSTHTTTSVRVTFPHERIAYKQIRVPPLMTLHTGLWTFTGTATGCTATSRHSVVLNEPNIVGVLGPEAGVAEARVFVATALSGNSLATLALAKEHAEKARAAARG